MDIKENFAKNLTLYRKALGLTQVELAEKLNYSDKAISKWERGEALPDVIVLKQIADIFSLKVDDLISEPKPVKRIIRNLGKKRVSVALWATSIVWLIAILFFAIGDIILAPIGIRHTWIAFIIAVPITLIVLLVLTHVWGKTIINYFITSLLCWSLLTCVFLVLLFALPVKPRNLWEIFLIGIPLQALITFLFLWKRVK